MRIIAGKYRGKKLVAPDGLDTRPTADRAREALFCALDARLRKQGTTWDEITILDAFAGTGALGLEALSRGAKSLTAMEINPVAIKALRENVSAFLKDGCRISLENDVLSPSKPSAAVDFVFMDPPYNKGLVAAGLDALTRAGWIDGQTLCLIEVEKGEQNILPAGFKILQERIYGKAKILFVEKD